MIIPYFVPRGLLDGPGFGRTYSLAAVPPSSPFNHLFLHHGLPHTHGRPSSHFRVGGLLLTLTCLNLPVSAPHLLTRFR
jgi:hypothetical protein